jgi:hypothetical protein
MKKLSREAMKKVMGGNVYESGCYMGCCMSPVTEEDVCSQWGAVLYVDTCEGKSSMDCAGYYFAGCHCHTGPHAS